MSVQNGLPMRSCRSSKKHFLKLLYPSLNSRWTLWFFMASFSLFAYPWTTTNQTKKQRAILNWLVVWLPFFIFPYIGLLIIPIDELIFFRGVFPQPPTSQSSLVTYSHLPKMKNMMKNAPKTMVPSMWKSHTKPWFLGVCVCVIFLGRDDLPCGVLKWG